MKRVVLTFVVLLSFVSSWSQTDEISKEQADKLNAVTIKLMNQERYDDAIKTKERELVILKALNGETDSTYIKQLAFSAKLYYRNNQPEEAVKALHLVAISALGIISRNSTKNTLLKPLISFYSFTSPTVN